MENIGTALASEVELAKLLTRKSSIRKKIYASKLQQ
jgi:hypothetical protein